MGKGQIALTYKPKNQYTAQPTIVDYHQTKKALVRVLLDRGESWDRIVKQSGCSRQTISAIKKGETEVSQDLCAALKKTESDKLTLAIHSILDGTITPENIAAASLQQGVTSAAILIEKRGLIEGRPTHIIGFEDLRERGKRARAALARLQAEELALTAGGTYERIARA